MELVDEQRGRPEVGGCVGQVGAVAAADLVVVDDGASGFVGEFGEVADVVVRHAGAAVENEQRQGARPRCRPVLVILTHVSWSAEGTVRVCDVHGAQHEPAMVSLQDHCSGINIRVSTTGRPDRWPTRTAVPPSGLLRQQLSMPTRVDEITDRLVTAIAIGEYLPGARLPVERDLAARWASGA